MNAQELDGLVAEGLSRSDAAERLEDLWRLLTDPTTRSWDRPWLPNRYTEASMPGVGVVHARVAREIVAQMSIDDPFERAEWGALILLAPAPDAVPAAMGLAADERPLLRLVGLQALGELGDPAGADLARAALRAPHAGLRATAAAALGRLGGADDVATLISRVGGDPAPEVRHWAAKALGELGGAAALEVLLEQLREPKLDDLSWLGVRGGLARLGDPARDALLAQIKGGETRVRRRAAEALGFFDGTAVRWELAKLMRADALELALMAAWALAHIGDARGTSRLIDELASSDPQRSTLGAVLMAGLGNGAAIVKLLARYFDPDVGAGVRAALGTVPLKGFSQVVEALHEAPSARFVRAACDVAGRLAIEEAVPYLERFQGVPQGDVAGAAAVALSRMRPGSHTLLEVMQRHRDPLQRLAIATSLRELHPPLPLQAVEALVMDECAPVVLLGIEALTRDRLPGAGLLLERIVAGEQQRLAGNTPRVREQNHPVMQHTEMMRGLDLLTQAMAASAPTPLRAGLTALGPRTRDDASRLVLHFALPAWVELVPSALPAAEAILAQL